MNYVLLDIKDSLAEVIAKELGVRKKDVIITYPPQKGFGDLSTPICFQLAKKKAKDKKQMRELAEKIAHELAEKLRSTKLSYIASVESLRGYVNFKLDYPEFSRDVINQILEMKENYGHLSIGCGETVIVEHTSANPIHPLHVGTARNAVLGDSISRILKAAGYNVRRHFYVNDMGRQVAVLVYGYRRVKDILQPFGKPDHWFGALYSTVASLLEFSCALRDAKLIKREAMQKNENLRRLLEKYPMANWLEVAGDELKGKLTKLEEWWSTLLDISKKWPEFLDATLQRFGSCESAEREINDLLKKFESGDASVKALFREVTDKVLAGFMETLRRAGIDFDSFDWESDIVERGLVNRILKELKPWTFTDETGALYLALRKAIIEKEDIASIFDMSPEDARKLLEKGKERELPPDLVLKRRDGTTLYTTRDIAYSVYKFEEFNASKVFNVIGKDQTLAQKQVRAALALAGYKNYAENLIHVAYEMVLLKGGKLSSRRGRLITFDEMIEEAKRIALEELRKRYPDEEERILNERAEKIAIGAIRYALISVAPEKVLEFDWSKVLDFERNSGPFLQYTYARARSIIRKSGVKAIDISSVDFSCLSTDIEREIVFELARFPEVVLAASRDLKPNIVVDYANKLAIAFNSFYQQYPVLKAETEELKMTRLALVQATIIVLGNAMELLGIPKLEVM